MLFMSPLGLGFWKQVCKDCLEGWDRTEQSRPEALEGSQASLTICYTPSGLWVCSPLYAHMVGTTELWGPSSDLTDPRLFSFTVRCEPGPLHLPCSPLFWGRWPGCFSDIPGFVGSNLATKELFQLVWAQESWDP